LEDSDNTANFASDLHQEQTSAMAEHQPGQDSHGGQVTMRKIWRAECNTKSIWDIAEMRIDLDGSQDNY